MSVGWAVQRSSTAAPPTSGELRPQRPQHGPLDFWHLTCMRRGSQGSWPRGRRPAAGIHSAVRSRYCHACSLLASTRRAAALDRVARRRGVLLTTYGMVLHNAEVLGSHATHDPDEGPLWDVMICGERRARGVCADRPASSARAGLDGGRWWRAGQRARPRSVGICSRPSLARSACEAAQHAHRKR